MNDLIGKQLDFWELPRQRECVDRSMSDEVIWKEKYSDSDEERTIPHVTIQNTFIQGCREKVSVVPCQSGIHPRAWTRETDLQVENELFYDSFERDDLGLINGFQIVKASQTSATDISETAHKVVPQAHNPGPNDEKDRVLLLHWDYQGPYFVQDEESELEVGQCELV